MNNSQTLSVQLSGKTGAQKKTMKAAKIMVAQASDQANGAPTEMVRFVLL